MLRESDRAGIAAIFPMGRRPLNHPVGYYESAGKRLPLLAHANVSRTIGKPLGKNTIATRLAQVTSWYVWLEAEMKFSPTLLPKFTIEW